jgi:hypothetical protein
MYACFHVGVSACICVCLFVSLSVCMHVCMFVIMFVCLSVAVQNFAQGPSRHTTRMKKMHLPWQVCSKQIYDLLTGGGFLLVHGGFCVGQAKLCVFANSVY